MENLSYVSRILAVGGLLGSASLALAQDMTLGGTAAAGAMSSTLSGGGASAVGGRAMQDARGAGSGSAGLGMDDGSGGGAAPGGAGPAAAGAPGSAAGGGARTAGPRAHAIHWTPETGEDFLAELRAAAGRSTGSRPRSRRSRVGRRHNRRATSVNHVSGQSQALPFDVVNSPNKYKLPPVGYLAWYLPQDRFKLVSGLWSFVTIEDDDSKYPVRFYYRPWSARMQAVLSRVPRTGVPRFNRVIGFRTWQDAMIAGYRPDPVSRPEPGAQVLYLAGLTRRPELARYTEFLYGGNIEPQVFDAEYEYVRSVADVVNAHPHTRPYLSSTIAQVLGATMGEGAYPREVGPRTNVTTTTKTTTGTAGAMTVAPGAPAAPVSAGEARTEDYDKFRGRAGALSSSSGARR